MKRLFMLLTMLALIGCGKNSPGTSGVVSNNPTPPTSSPIKCGDDRGDGLVVAGCVQIVVSKNDNAVSVVYTVADVGKVFTIDNAAIAINDTDPDVLGLGAIDVTNIKANKTRVCGTGSQRCGTAAIRIFTEELVAPNDGIAGFVNKTDGYGVPVLVTDEDAVQQTVGLALANSINIASLDISALNKFSETDFGTSNFPLEVDFSNAGAGSYEMTITVELTLGL